MANISKRHFVKYGISKPKPDPLDEFTQDLWTPNMTINQHPVAY